MASVMCFPSYCRKYNRRGLQYYILRQYTVNRVKKRYRNYCNIKKSQKNVLCYFVYAEGIEEVNAQASQYGITCYFTDVLGTTRTSMDVVRFPTIILLRQNREIIGKFTGYNKKNLEQIAKLIGAQ